MIRCLGFPGELHALQELLRVCKGGAQEGASGLGTKGSHGAEIRNFVKRNPTTPLITNLPTFDARHVPVASNAPLQCWAGKFYFSGASRNLTPTLKGRVPNNRRFGKLVVKGLGESIASILQIILPSQPLLPRISLPLPRTLTPGTRHAGRAQGSPVSGDTTGPGALAHRRRAAPASPPAPASPDHGRPALASPDQPRPAKPNPRAAQTSLGQPSQAQPRPAQTSPVQHRPAQAHPDQPKPAKREIWRPRSGTAREDATYSHRQAHGSRESTKLGLGFGIPGDVPVNVQHTMHNRR